MALQTESDVYNVRSTCVRENALCIFVQVRVAYCLWEYWGYKCFIHKKYLNWLLKNVVFTQKNKIYRAKLGHPPIVNSKRKCSCTYVFVKYFSQWCTKNNNIFETLLAAQARKHRLGLRAIFQRHCKTSGASLGEQTDKVTAIFEALITSGAITN